MNELENTETNEVEVEIPQKPTKKKKSTGLLLLRDVMYLLTKVAAILLIFALIFTFMFGAVRCPDDSMGPAFRNGDLVIYYRMQKNYTSQDAILFKYNGQEQVCRVVAVAGDTVNITDDGLMINGAYQEEPNIYTKTVRYANNIKFPMKIAQGQVFVLSDNRTNASDSRVYGAVNVNDTQGKVIMVFRKRNF